MTNILKIGTIVVTSNYYPYFEITEYVDVSHKYPINGNNGQYVGINLENKSSTTLLPNEIKITWDILDETQYLKIKDSLTEKYNKKLYQLEKAYNKVTSTLQLTMTKEKSKLVTANTHNKDLKK